MRGELGKWGAVLPAETLCEGRGKWGIDVWGSILGVAGLCFKISYLFKTAVTDSPPRLRSSMYGSRLSGGLDVCEVAMSVDGVRLFFCGIEYIN